MTKKNPILPRDALKAMDEGWTGFPTWSISPTISAHDLSGNPPIGLVGVKGQKEYGTSKFDGGISLGRYNAEFTVPRYGINRKVLKTRSRKVLDYEGNVNLLGVKQVIDEHLKAIENHADTAEDLPPGDYQFENRPELIENLMVKMIADIAGHEATHIETYDDIVKGTRVKGFFRTELSDEVNLQLERVADMGMENSGPFLTYMDDVGRNKPRALRVEINYVQIEPGETEFNSLVYENSTPKTNSPIGLIGVKGQEEYGAGKTSMGKYRMGIQRDETDTVVRTYPLPFGPDQMAGNINIRNLNEIVTDLIANIVNTANENFGIQQGDLTYGFQGSSFVKLQEDLIAALISSNAGHEATHIETFDDIVMGRQPLDETGNVKDSLSMELERAADFGNVTDDFPIYAYMDQFGEGWKIGGEVTKSNDLQVSIDYVNISPGNWGFRTEITPSWKTNPPGVPKEASELSKEQKKEIRKKWLELVNMTATELQTFYDSDLGNKKAGLSREEAKEAGISSGRDSALAIIKMKQTPVKEWHKRHSKDRGRDIMLDFWQWAQKQINFNTRHRAMRGSYLDEKGRPKRKLLGLWIWGHDPWRYAIKVKSERLPKCPDVPWIGSAEKKRFGVLPKMNPKFKVLTGNIVTISGPSSAGKSTIAKALSEKMRANMVPSYMTREPRPNEQQGVDGFFVSVERFEDMIANGDFTTKEGVDLWVKQKNGEYYGRRVSDFMGSKAVVVDVNFEGLRKMRKAFPGRTYSVFIRTAQGPKRRRENLEKRGVHTEEEIESRVRAGTNMLQTFGKMNFDFIAANKFGEVEKNVAMIASEFRKWGKSPKANPKFHRPSKRCSGRKSCGGKVIYKSMSAAIKAIDNGFAGGNTAYHSVQCQDRRNPRVYHTKTGYMSNPPAIRMGAELLHKPSGLKLKYIGAEIDEDGKTWYIVEYMDGAKSRLEDSDLDFYSLWPKSSLWKTNPPFNLRDIISVMSPRAIVALENSVIKFFRRKPKKPVKPTIKTARAEHKKGDSSFIQRYPTPEALLESNLRFHEKKIREYKMNKAKYDNEVAKLEKFYGYGGKSKNKMVDAVINTIAKEFKGKPVINGYRAQFALNIDKDQMLDFLRDNGPGRFFSAWKQGADIYFDKFSKTESWTKVPGGVVWLITAEISVLDIDWRVTLSNRFIFPEEKELALLRSPMEAKQRNAQNGPYTIRNYVTVKRIDVWGAKEVAKYAQKFDKSGGGMRRQPWLSSKLKPLVSHDLLMKANPPVGDFDGAMDMGIQKDGPSRYHGHHPSGVESFVPDMATQWKNKSFRVEMPLNSKAEADGTYTMGFLEKHEDDDRPYIVSIKYDGDNNILHFDGEETVIFTRRGRWRKDFHLTDQITASLKKNGVSSAIILGELYVVDQDGKTVPLSQQSSFTQAPKNLNMQESMRFAAFDILEINGKNIEDTPYVARMDILKPLIHGDAVKVVEHWRSKGGMNEVMEAWNEGISNDPNFEGLIVRFEGDNKSIKVKMHGTADLAVLGFYYGEEGGRDEAIVGGGALAWMDENGDFVLAGNSVLGSSVVEKAELLQRLLPTAVDAPKVKWGDHIVDRSITHDHRGRGAITPVEPHLIGEFKYRSLNYSERPVYRFEDGHYFQVGTKRAPVLFQCTFGRWRPDKSLTHQDLRMTQVAGEGEGKWKKNPHKQDGPYAWWEPDPRGHQIYNNSSSLQYINNQLVGDQNISRRDVFNTVAEGVERKYGVRYQIVSPKEAEQIDYLKDMDAFFDGRNYGTWDEKNGVVYFNEEMFNDRKTALRELGHETGAVIIASMYGGKDNIPRADYHGMNSVKGLTHLVDSYTFGWYEPKPGQSKAIVRSNPPEDDDTNYPGGTAQFLLDGILLGSLKSKMNDWRTEGVSKTVTLKDWPIHYPELAARLEEAEKLGWSVPSIPKVKVNPSQDEIHPKTPGGKTIPKRYLKGLTKEEMQIAIKEIDKGYEYDIDDPEAYEYWKSDIKATARGYKTVPSKYKKKFIEMYGPLPEKGKFLDKMAKATGIKKSILQKVYKKGLAAWRTGHRPGVQQHQWAAGRVYSFVTLGNTVKKGKKKMGDFQLAIEAGLIKENGVLPSKKGGTFPKAAYIYDPPENEEYALHVEVQKNKRKYKKLVKEWMDKNHNASWSWAGDFKTEAEKKKFDQAKAYAKENIDGRMVCSVQCIACYYKQGGMKEAEIRERAKGVKENPPIPGFSGDDDDDDDIDYTFENLEDGGGVATYKATGEATFEDAREMVYRLWNDDPDWVKELRDLATENEMTYFVQGKRIDDVTYQLIISASHVDDADLLDIVTPAIPMASLADQRWQKGIPNPPKKSPQKNNGPPRQAVKIPTVIVFEGMIRRELADGFGSEDGIFIFGDNEARRGKGGQAKELRGLDIAYGIRTKKRPSLDESAFWSDKTYKTNIKMMSEDFLEAFMAAGGDGTLYVPQNGIGTGMAQLKSRAPKTYKWLKTFLDNLIRTGNERDVKDNIKKWRMK